MIFTDAEEFVAGLEKTAFLEFISKPIRGAAAFVGSTGKLVGKEGLPGVIRSVSETVSAHPWATISIGGGMVGAHALHGLLKNKIRASAQNEIFKEVQKDDPVLRDADRTELQSAFETFRTFAPTLALDPNAMRSFLREAVTSGGGVSYNTVNLLARTENAIKGETRDDR